MASDATSQRPSHGAIATVVVVLLLVPCALIVAKAPALPTSAFLTSHVTLTHVPPALQGTIDNVIFVPLGALLVVIFRLTLGLRVLGPFRSILLAFAFLATGILTGLLFLGATVAVLVVLRPLLRSLRLPYFGRISVMLSTVALLIVVVAMVGTWADSDSLREVAGFPVVVLCLIGDAVARTSEKESMRSGLWRTAMTALVAVVVAAVASYGPLRDLLVRYPELLLVNVALIVLVSTYCAWRLLDRLNPERTAARRRGSSKHVHPTLSPPLRP